MKGCLFLLILTLFVPSAEASIEIAVGTTSATSGRMVPSLGGTINLGGWTFSVVSSGVRTPLYYHSAYMVGAYKVWISGALLWGVVRSGFGGAVFYADRGFKDGTSATLETTNDFAVGPAIRMNWDVGGPLFFNLEAMYGLRKPWAHLLFSFQDFVVLSFGIRI